MTLYNSIVDARIRSTSKWYWNKNLKGKSTVQYDDVLQFCRLRILELGITNPNFVSRQIQWSLSSEFMRRGHRSMFAENACFEYLENPKAEERGKANYQLHHLNELRAQNDNSLTPDRRERLLENLWVVGTPSTYETIAEFMDGGKLRWYGKPGGIDYTVVQRGTETVLKAFPTLADLTGFSPALWFPKPATKTLRLYSFVHKLILKQPMPRRARMTLKTLVSYDQFTKLYTPTDEGFKYVESFPPEQKAFLARQF